jgi:hypothetical protein
LGAVSVADDGELDIEADAGEVEAFMQRHGVAYRAYRPVIIALVRGASDPRPKERTEAEIVAEWQAFGNGADRFVERLAGPAATVPSQRAEVKPPAWDGLPPCPTYSGIEVATLPFFRWLARRRSGIEEPPPHRIPRGWWLG